MMGLLGAGGHKALLVRIRYAAFIALSCCAMAFNASAETVHLTVYDDGRSCPGDCDAHVVFHSSMNGTEFAHAPTTSAQAYGKCVVGQVCRICIESGKKQCLETKYRGSGPPPMTFDLTPKFYQSACSQSPRPSSLAAKCKEIGLAAATLEKRRNCILESGHPLCSDLMRLAVATRAKDLPAYELCMAEGEKEYNKPRPLSERRSLGCAYEAKGTGGPNSKGSTWRKLLPASCRQGTFVGRDGLDCCSGNTWADGPLGTECRIYYPGKKPS